MLQGDSVSKRHYFPEITRNIVKTISRSSIYL
jgi:hypothetical protein